MNAEEKPTRDLESDSAASPDSAALDPATVPATIVPVEASLADDVAVEAEIVESGNHLTSTSYPPGNHDAAVDDTYLLNSAPALSGNFENLAAKGGAVGALVLGIWCLAGSFITNWSVINGLLGLMMGFWGLTSRHKKMAWIGIAFCMIGILLCLVQVSEIISVYLNARDEI